MTEGSESVDAFRIVWGRVSRDLWEFRRLLDEFFPEGLG